MESLFLTISIVVALIYNEEDWRSFLLTAILAASVGGFCKWIGDSESSTHLTRADSFLIVSLSWVVFSFIGMVPFLLLTDMDVASAFFETMSGFTTTGATCINNIESMSHALLFWRSMTHWMGGLGIVVFSFALIPVSEMKNSNIFSAETTGISLDKLRPKIGATARRLLTIYLILTAICAFFYWIGPMGIFDAICHSMSTIATGGFSTHSASLAYFQSSYIEYVASFFMLISGVNFSLYYYMSIGKQRALFRNEEMLTFFGISGAAVIMFCLLFYFAPISNDVTHCLPHGIEETFRSSLFHVCTIISSTGFAAQKFDYVAWGASFWMPTVVIMAMGACAGSTAGGIKIIRVLICIKSIINELIYQLHPRAILSVRVNGKNVSEDSVRRTMTFICLYIILVAIAMTCHSLLGADVDTALGSSVSMLSNVGPGTGSTGPASNFSHVPAAGKWLMSFYMLVGRLEIFTVLFLFMPNYWKERK